MAESVPLPPGPAWTGVSVTVARIADLAGHRDWLTAEEQSRAERLRLPGATQEWIGIWSWVRESLADQLAVHPAHVPVRRDQHGRPRLIGAGDEIDFNISHAGGWVALAVADRPVGVDIETEYRGDDLLNLAAVVAHPDELADLTTAGALERPGAFARMWTRKEALLKAIGTGFGDEPRHLSVGVGPRPARHAAWTVADLPTRAVICNDLHGAVAVHTGTSAVKS